MLQIALRPAPVADRHVDQGRRATLVGPLQSRKHAHLPSGAAQEGCLYEIMALDVSTKGGTT